MKYNLIYGTSALVSLLGLIFSFVSIKSFYSYNYTNESISIIQILPSILLIILISCEIIKIIKKYNNNYSRNASLINIGFFILGILFLISIKNHDFIDFTNVIWGGGTILLGYITSLIMNIIIIIRHRK